MHTPEKYGIYQSVGDTSGPGGIVRALRTIPMMQEIALAIKGFSPNAWVINYTNPMTVSIKTLYSVFPEIKAFGCCHEVFGTQKVLSKALKYICGIDNVSKDEIKVNVVGVNHFTWFTQAMYKNINLFEVYKKFADKYSETSFNEKSDENWMNHAFSYSEKVKLDLFNRYGYIAAAGDRHLAEFCPGHWYLESPEQVNAWKFALTPVSWRKQDLQERLEKSEKLVSGEQQFEIKETGEEGVNQMRAILGLCELVTNVNIPNKGQIPNLPIGAVVETNAVFRSNSLTPVFSGSVPKEIFPLIARVCGEQELIAQAGLNRDLNMAFRAFVNDPLVTTTLEDSKKLFREMLDNTKNYLTMYDLKVI